MNLLNQIIKISVLSIEALLNHNKLMFCGNGGSASDSNHLAAELVGKFYQDRKPLNAVSLTANTSTITAIANDFGFENIFSRQINGLGHEGDILFALSTSGNSENIINAIKIANSKKIKTILLTGKNDSKSSEISNYSIKVNSDFPGIIQQSHIAVGQLIC